MLDYKNKRRFFSSWSACKETFKPVLALLRSKNIADVDFCTHINTSSGKYVYRGKLNGFDFAYKTQKGKAFWRYIFQPSLPLRECYNYEILRALHIPVPEVLAVGDTRKFFILQESFLVTEFLQDTCDGRVFMPGGAMRNGFEDLRNAYAKKHLLLLAKYHDAHRFHKAFHPRNLLFRGTNAENMEVFWIDVARLRKARNMKFAILKDLHTFFRDMLMPEKDVEQLLEFYIQCAENKVFTSVGELKFSLTHFKRKPFSKRKFPLFQEKLSH